MNGGGENSRNSTLDLMTDHVLDLLIVDDSEADVSIVRRYLGQLEGLDWRLRWAETAEEGLEALGEARFDACLVDFRLDDSDGIEFIRDAQAICEQIPFILLTGENRREIDVAAMRAGAVDFLAKDHVDPASLERAIRYALERRRTQTELVRLARRDPLTGLHNRASLEERIQAAIERVEAREGTRFALCLSDLDGFKPVNDIYGHETGDELLRIIGRRLTGAVRPYDTVGRLGGDEFVVLLERVGQRSEALAVARRLCEAIQPPYEVQAPLCQVTASIGVAFYPEHGDTPLELLRAADAAMYEAKRAGKGQVVVNEGDATSEVGRALPRTREELVVALRHGSFGLCFQPVVDLRSGRAVGLEAFARFPGCRRPIADVIAELEASGAVVELDLWVLGRVAAALRSQPELPRISVNLSVHTLLAPGCLSRIGAVVSGVEERVELEIPEAGPRADDVALAQQIETLRECGLRVALDAFGAGHSVIERLVALPVDAVKVDRAFVARLGADRRSEALLAALLAFGRSAHVDVVCVGVETAEEEDILRRLGAEMAQGYHLGKLVDEEQLRRWCERGAA